MLENNLLTIIKDIVLEATRLKDRYVSENDLMIDWVCIFSKSEDEYNSLLIEAKKIGRQIETTDSGVVFQFDKRPETCAGKPKIFKIRKNDPTKNERGDSDFVTDYNSFKEKYLGNVGFKLIPRDSYEMIELMDPEFDARVYFSSIPPSKLRGIN